MSMRSATSPRRIYLRAGSPIVCYAGVYFGPKLKAESKISPDKEVTVEVLDNAGARKRIAVTQRVGKNKVTETWSEKHLTFEKRTPAADAPAE